jgi:hypothetical protein
MRLWCGATKTPISSSRVLPAWIVTTRSPLIAPARSIRLAGGECVAFERTPEHSSAAVKALIEHPHGLPRRFTDTRSSAIQGDGKGWPEPAHARLSAGYRFCGGPVARITMIR